MEATEIQECVEERNRLRAELEDAKHELAEWNNVTGYMEPGDCQAHIRGVQGKLEATESERDQLREELDTTENARVAAWQVADSGKEQLARETLAHEATRAQLEGANSVRAALKAIPDLELQHHVHNWSGNAKAVARAELQLRELEAEEEAQKQAAAAAEAEPAS